MSNEKPVIKVGGSVTGGEIDLDGQIKTVELHIHNAEMAKLADQKARMFGDLTLAAQEARARDYNQIIRDSTAQLHKLQALKRQQDFNEANPQSPVATVDNIRFLKETCEKSGFEAFDPLRLQSAVDGYIETQAAQSEKPKRKPAEPQPAPVASPETLKRIKEQEELIKGIQGLIEGVHRAKRYDADEFAARELKKSAYEARLAQHEEQLARYEADLAKRQAALDAAKRQAGL
jgi:hypothetical protein